MCRPYPSRCAGRALSLLALSLAISGTPLAAQGAPHAWFQGSGTEACYDAIPPRAFSRVAVYVQVDADSSTLPAVELRSALFSADALLQGLAERVRTMLGGAIDTLPRGEPVLGDSLHVWRAVGGDLLITVHRDGRMLGRVDTTRADSGAAALFRRALEEAAKGGEFFIWPTDGAAATLDSVRLRVSFDRATVDSTGRPHEMRQRRPSLPVFSMLAPWEEPVRPHRVASPIYPEFAREHYYRGSTLLQFVVDSTGRPIVSTIRDLHASDASALSNQGRQAYDAFVRAATESVKRSRFVPARIAGCRIRQLVQLPFTFELAR
jgi:hypothetical protein